MCICDLFMGKGWLDCGQQIKVILIFVMNSQIFDGDYIMFTYPGLVQIDLSITDYNFCEDNSTAYMTHCTQVRFFLWNLKFQLSTLRKSVIFNRSFWTTKGQYLSYQAAWWRDWSHVSAHHILLFLGLWKCVSMIYPQYIYSLASQTRSCISDEGHHMFENQNPLGSWFVEPIQVKSQRSYLNTPSDNLH